VVLLHLLIALVLVGSAWQVPGCRSPRFDCIDFESGPIPAGQSYLHPIQNGLVFRFTAEAARRIGSDTRVWHITVGPAGPGDGIDYVWPVSLPINSTHHLFVGPGLDWTAADSLAINPRRLHFVLTADDLKEAERVYAEATKQVVAGSSFNSKALRKLGAGDLTVTLLDGAVNGGRIESIRLIVRSCVPTPRARSVQRSASASP
jgi:hypothetical protein